MSPQTGYYTYDSTVGADSVAGAAATPGVHRIAAFDFDGTSMDGNSPVQLVLYLAKKNMLSNLDALRIGLWALRYKLRLPQDEAWVRGMVFRAFEGKPVDEVDRFLYDFYDEEIAPRFRAAADAAMQRHHMAGDTVLVVSATFEPIVRRAMETHPIDGQVSTRMCIENGVYTRRVDGLPVEGDQKLVAIKEWCDAAYGEGNWELAYAYGDHHSDRPMLDAAENAFAVNPDCPLSRTAKQKKWTVLEW